MVLVRSLNLELGSKMPDFVLKDFSGLTYEREFCMGEKGLLIAFTCNHCPYALAVWDRLISIANMSEPLGIKTVAINPNIHPYYPEDSPENMFIFKKERGFSFPYLVDYTQEIAKAYKAQCTPDLYLLDSEGCLVYHGRLDDSWKDASKVGKEELKLAIEALSLGKISEESQHPSLGCSIKWRG
ncbi:MAG: thioredoxin family protein [bacterium]|nr:thioredoxin family protein [bacterium]